MKEVGRELAPRKLGFFAKLALGFLGFVVLLVLFIAVFIGVENLRGSHAWKAVWNAHEKSGDPLGVAAVIPPAVPPADNFAETPMFKHLLDHRVGEKSSTAEREAADLRIKKLTLGSPNGGAARLPDGRMNLEAWRNTLAPEESATAPASSPAEGVLAGLHRWEADLDELERASRRPFSRFGVRYEDGFNAEFPHLGILKGIISIYELRSASLLAVGDPDRALRDVETAERIAGAVHVEPTIISMLVEFANRTIATRMAWQGLVDHRWNAAHLEHLQTLFEARPDPMKRFAMAIKGERAFVVAAFDPAPANRSNLSTIIPPLLNQPKGTGFAPVSRTVPPGWLRQNQISLVRYYDSLLANPPTKANEAGLVDGVDGLPRIITDRFWPYQFLAKMMLPAVNKTELKAFRALTVDRMAVLACALERYRIANRKYPGSLEELAPRYISNVPVDPATGGAFAYQPGGDDWYRLASAGPPRPKKIQSGVSTHPEPDWVWPSAVPAEARLF